MDGIDDFIGDALGAVRPGDCEQGRFGIIIPPIAILIGRGI